MSEQKSKQNHDELKLDTEEREVMGLETIDSDDVEEQDAKLVASLTSIVPRTDDPSTPAVTFRSIFLGSLFSALFSYATTILSFRTNPFTPSATLIVLVSYPLGLFFAKILPDVRVKIFGTEMSLNPGPFSIKEHIFVYIVSNAASTPFTLYNVASQVGPNYMNNTNIQGWQSLLFVLTSNFIGLGLAGFTRHFLVKPPAMFWPSTLSNVALFVSFHEKNETPSKYTWSRYKFFWVWFAVMFCWTWVSQWIAPAIQVISILCLFGAGANSYTNIFGSGSNGTGILAVTFDWGSATQFVAPLVTPYWATCAVVFSWLFWGWIITPISYVGNWWDSQSLGCSVPGPTGCGNINSISLYNGTNFSQSLSVVSLYDTTTYNLDLGVYNVTKPIHMTAFFAISYATGFAGITSCVSHIALFYGKDIVRQLRTAIKQFRAMEHDENALDIHNKLMAAYPETPTAVYIGIFAVSAIVMLIIGQTTPYRIPWYATLLAVCIGIVFIVPIGILQAISGQQLGVNIITEFIAGLMMPGQTVPVMVFKGVGYQTMLQALALLSDLKLGHYMKIDPRAMLGAQILGSVIASVVMTPATTSFLFGPLYGTADWQAPWYGTAYTAGAIWGAIGPTRFFGIGSLYQATLWAFPIGLVLPIVPWIGNRIYKHQMWHLAVNIPILMQFQGPGNGNQIFVITVFVFATAFQFYAHRYKNEWWKKYCYVLQASFDGATAVVGVLINIISNIANHDGNAPFTMPNWALNPATSPDYYCFGQGWQASS
ncbi:OPT oligopeptide transporter protein-domain-containing protein [Polychytrium aggregatum]|uniref:OPT oligopeptide transporter protein-domain-containing protein n=1 Tax=Polychytrium aggregatum TaxID=110093 RepID=UPI0022FF40B8|nr:OPT oligopeptide transporter protein-domain-containing protein [Polychytrium aggregatum]KAI9206662.1 OPT oligopeptide transporter protein-domain-containing protein [Polychytrium aggregatum]